MMAVMKFASLVVLAAAACVSVDGLYCFTCTNAPSNRYCTKYGEYKKCMKNENACHNSVRRGPFGTMITKRCKQVAACDNNYIQNPRAAWSPSQCNGGKLSSVCRCCCSFDGCNRHSIQCLQKPGCNRMLTPSNGSQKCSKANMSIGTVCRFQCDEGFAMEGRKRSKCIRKRGSPQPRFNRPPPTCKRSQCPDLINAPQHGTMECTNGVEIGSVCSFVCETDHDLLGNQKITCLDNGEWSSVPPACVLVECAKMDPPVNGAVSCTFGNDEDSECTFTCDDDYQVIGASLIVCLDIDGVGSWSEEVPACQKKICKPTDDIEKGSFSCNFGTNLGSTCTYKCDDGYSLTGNPSVTCVNIDGEVTWHRPPPTCDPNRCEMEAPFYNGKVDCTNDNVVGSVCTYTCHDDRHYTLTPPGVVTNQCLNDTTWDIPRPCCYATCDDQTNFDGLILLDSSSSVGRTNFVNMKDFVKRLVTLFDIGANASRIGIFRYNRRVDARSQIHLNQYLTAGAGLLAAIDRIPYDGSGTFTGRALTHARDEFLEEANGNRPHVHDIIILITDGRAADNVQGISEELRESGISVVVVGIVPPRGRLDLGQLRTIATSPEDLLIVESGFADLNTDLFNRVATRFCVEGCLE